jgi:membrane-associated phospholipid phosphatase
LHAIWVFVTDCGDSAVMVPLALLTAIFLFVAGSRRLAIFWCVAVGGSAVAIALLKLAFGGCGYPLTRFAIASPSGHSALSTAVYGALTLLVAANLNRRWRVFVYAGAAILIVGIALSRVVLHDHNLAEIVIGLTVGAGGVAVFRAGIRQGQAPTLRLGWLLLGAVAVVVVMHGTRWMIEPAVHRLAGSFRFALPWCR